MVQGTASHTGKTIMVAGLCRILRDMGLRVAPFKAQNMALNAFVTDEGGEIGVAQALQARAARIAPSVDHNPLLLKPAGGSACQVIIHGRVFASKSPEEYNAFKSRAMDFVMESFTRLANSYDVVVLEGAGSPAEVNLRENDIANMGIAARTDSPVVLVGDIDRGGLFASLVGTMELLEPHEKVRVKAFIINKFRGDVALLQPGIDFLTERTGIETLGVVPYMEALNLPDEDGVALERTLNSPGREAEADEAKAGGRIRIVVLKLPSISNFTDFDPFGEEPSVSLEFRVEPSALRGADMVILPGSKNTQRDLRWLRSRGLDSALGEYRASGGVIAGICGGFQMLGRSISDPLGIESSEPRSPGLGLLDIETTLRGDKTTFKVEARAINPLFEGASIKGYEIHTGQSTPSKRPLFAITKRGADSVDITDGAVSGDGLIWGTYIHGLFHNDGLRQTLLTRLAEARGLQPPAGILQYEAILEQNIDALARTLRESLNMPRLLEIIGIKGI